MAYLKLKTIKSKKYYYAVECKRINGKPRTVNQIYLGTVEQLLTLKQKADTPQKPQEVAVLEFGIVAACYGIAQKLNIVQLIDHLIPKRKQGLSVGEYLLIAAISRAVKDISKRACWAWVQQTCLPRLMNYQLRKHDLSSQRFWDHMDKVPVSLIAEMEKAISQRVIELYGLDLHFLIYDTTNFYTYIDTFNDRSQLAQRGKNKQKRYDLRQVNLALAVTRDFHIPLFHKLYEGNRPDSTSFTGIIDQLVGRYKLLSRYCKDITIIYDKGNNSEKNQKKVDTSPYHYVGSLKLNEFPELTSLDTASPKFKPLAEKRLEGVRAYRLSESILGEERTVVVTFSQSFYDKQIRTLQRVVAKCDQQLAQLQKKLQKRLDAKAAGKSVRGTPLTYESVVRQVRTILNPQYMKRLFDVTISQQDDLVRLSYTFNASEFSDIERTRLGKTILFTDQETWTTEEIILAYRGQYRIEAAFKITKRRHFIAWQPNFHWTDQKLHVHAFYCILSLMFISLAYRQVRQAGIDIGLPTLEKELEAIKEVITLQLPASGRLQKAKFYRTLTKKTPEQETIYRALELESVAPN